MKCPFCLENSFILISCIEDRCTKCNLGVGYTFENENNFKIIRYVFVENIFFDIESNRIYGLKPDFSLNLKNKTIKEIVDIYKRIKQNKCFV